MIVKGGHFSDERGSLKFNNDFDLSEIKRMYIIENKDTSIIRAWQGHKIERRWFTCIEGAFEIRTIKVDDWAEPSKDLEMNVYKLVSESLDTLKLEAGFITSIQATEPKSKLLVFSDYQFGDVNDEYKFPVDYFN